MLICKLFKQRFIKKTNLPLFFLGLLFFLTPLAYGKGIFSDSSFAKTWVFYLCALFLSVSLLIEDFLERSGSRENNYNVKPVRLPWPLLLFLFFIAWMVITSFFGLRPGISIGRAIDFVAKGAIFVIIFSHASRFSLIKISLWIAAALSLVSLLGIAQYFDIAPEYWYQRVPPAATFINKNHAAYYIGLALPSIFLLIIWARGKKLILLSGVFLWLSLTYVFYTRTRGLWVALSLASVYLFILYLTLNQKRAQRGFLSSSIGRFKRTVVIVAVIASIGAAFIPGNIDSIGLIGRVASIGDLSGSSIKARLSVWRNTLEIIKDYPLTGVGANGFQFIYPAYSNKIVSTPTFSPTLQFFETHNDYLQYTSEMGIPGGFMFLFMAMSVPLLTINTIRKIEHVKKNIYGLIFLSMSLVTVLGHALFDFPTLSGGSGNLIWPLWALWLSRIFPQNRENQAKGMGHFSLHGILINRHFLMAINIFSAFIIGIMLLISTGKIIGGKQLAESAELFEFSKTYGRNSCTRLESEIKEANINMPFYAVAQRYRAEIFAFCNSPSGFSRAQMEQFLIEDPYNTELWLNLVPFRIETGDLKGSNELLDKFLKIFPESAEAIALRGYIFQIMGNNLKSDLFYKKALEIKPQVYSKVTEYRAKRNKL